MTRPLVQYRPIRLARADASDIAKLFDMVRRNYGDKSMRHALADALEDVGRTREAESLRGKGFVLASHHGDIVFGQGWRKATQGVHQGSHPDHTQDIGEGPFDSLEEAHRFGESEVGVPYSIVPVEMDRKKPGPTGFPHPVTMFKIMTSPQGPTRFARAHEPVDPQHEAFYLDAIAKNPDDESLHHAYADLLADQGRHGEALFISHPHVKSRPGGAIDVDKFPWRPSYNHDQGVEPGKTYYSVYGFHPHAPHPNDRIVQMSVTRVDPESTHRTRFAKYFHPHEAAQLIKNMEAAGVERSNREAYDSIYQRLMQWVEANPRQKSPVRHSAYRAPRGGAVVRGTFYQGGKLIPDLEGEFANPPQPEAPVQYPQPSRPSLKDRLKSKFGRKEPLVVRYARPVLQYASNLKHSIQSPDFAQWFQGSKIADETGVPKTVYHGTSRGDRIGNRLLKGRSTSGPMPFFTDDPEIAGSYATGKQDTSLAYSGPENYEQQFTMKVGRNSVPIDRAWWFLNSEEQQKISQFAPRVGMSDDGSTIQVHGPEHTSGTGGYDHHIQETKGNHLKALVEEWLNSGNLFNSEHEFLDVLRHAGLNRDVKFNDPHATRPAVLPAHLSIKNPLVTSAIDPNTIKELERAANRQRSPKSQNGADIWDKNIRDAREWVQQLKQDQAEGKNSFVWTSIPDWVTRTLRRLGHDGIIDTGGKMGGEGHNVYIPFHPDQVRVAMGNPR